MKLAANELLWIILSPLLLILGGAGAVMGVIVLCEAPWIAIAINPFLFSSKPGLVQVSFFMLVGALVAMMGPMYLVDRFLLNQHRGQRRIGRNLVVAEDERGALRRKNAVMRSETKLLPVAPMNAKLS